VSKARVIYTPQEIEAVASDVHGELCALGLLTEGLMNTPIVTVNTDFALKGAYGLYVTHDHPWYRFRGMPKGAIVVPLVSLQGLIDRFRKKRASLRDTMRHELGHAFAYTSGRAVRKNKKFVQAFGADNDKEARARYRSDCINLTAMENPAEDFAECWSAYVRYGGDTSRFRAREHLFRKMKFIKTLPRAVRKSGKGVYKLPKRYRATVYEG